MRASRYPWYEEVLADAPIDQGTIIEGCRVFAWQATLPVHPLELDDGFDDYIFASRADCIVMTQTCDLVNEKVDCVTLCPVISLVQIKTDFETQRGSSIKSDDWRRIKNDLKNGRWNHLVMLNSYDPPAGGKLPKRDVRFVQLDVIYTLPRLPLQAWAEASVEAHLHLLPPYREELSQMFARFFMRIGLPVDRAF
jgi:hypothetical protein